jgi:sugar phosphate isomerase/epimerase
MQLRNPHRPERSDEESFAMVAEAGFDGLCLDPSVEEITENLDKRPLFEAHGLGCMVNAFPYSPGDMEPLLDFANDMNACMVNVISGVMPVKPEEAVPVVLDWIGTAERKRMPLLFETHRDGLLNDLYCSSWNSYPRCGCVPTCPILWSIANCARRFPTGTNSSYNQCSSVPTAFKGG